MTKIFCKTLIVILLKFITSYSQEIYTVSFQDSVSDEFTLNQLIENEAEAEEYLLDDIYSFIENPIDINNASPAELTQLPFITNIVVNKIIEYRNNKKITSIKELQNIEGINKKMFSLLKLCVFVKAENTPRIKSSFLSTVKIDSEEKYGFKNKAYLGDPIKMLNAVKISLQNSKNGKDLINAIEFGGLLDKDSGEKYENNFMSAYGLIRTNPSEKISTDIIFGNYKIEMAEGLIFWNSYSFGKGGDIVLPVRKNGKGVKPYFSSDENSFYKGIAISVNANDVGVQIMYSDKKINASIDELGSITSIDKTGLFRSKNEIGKYKSAREQMIAAHLDKNLNKQINIGYTSYKSIFSHPLKLSKTGSRNTFWMNGFNVSYSNSQVDLFSELAIDYANRISFLSGMIYEPTDIITVSCVYRNYDENFTSIHGNAFSETTDKVQNEVGLYAGIKIKTFEWMSVSGYYDQFKNFGARYSIPVSSYGTDFLVLAEIQLSKNKYFVNLRYKQKELPDIFYLKDDYGRNEKKIESRLQENFRIDGIYKSGSTIDLSNRIEIVKANYNGAGKSEKGFLISQSIRWKNSYIDLRARFSLFSTDSYESRIYEYEDRLQRVSSFSPMYGNGARWYFLAKIYLLNQIEFAGKYAQTIKSGVRYIGTGYDMTDGNVQSDITFQLYIKY